MPMAALSLVVSLLLAPTPTPQDAPASAPREMKASERDYRWFDPIIDLRQMIDAMYVDQADASEMQQAALAAMLESLGDPYSIYVPPSAERSFDKSLRGHYVGIGAEVDMPDDRLRIVSPLEDSPALEAGIMPGDVVLEIDGTSTESKSVDECISLLMGEPGSVAKIRVRHADGREEELAVERRAISAKTVKGFRRVTTPSGPKWMHMLDPSNGIAYVQVTQFTDTTAADLRHVLDAAIADGAKAFIIDLRFNGGGSLGSAIEIADFFLADGRIVEVRGRGEQQRGGGASRTWEARDQPNDLEIPIVVLVNESSASASEVLAGAIAERLGGMPGAANTARVLGTRTFGKGSVQEVVTLPDGRGTVKLTTARYYLPSGRNLTRSRQAESIDTPWGVDPDLGYYVSMDDMDNREMFLARRRWEMPDGAPTDPAKWSDLAWLAAAPGTDGVTGLGDRQLAAAVTALRDRVSGRPWPRVGADPSAEMTTTETLHRAQSYRERLARELEATDKRIKELEESLAKPAATPSHSASDAGADGK
ncbi:MAG: S41 family peptidase [Phycisphaerae bacterium]|nr:S41 family peptidase [Phycisphaerae bacterium]